LDLNALSTVLSFHDTELSADVPNPVRGCMFLDTGPTASHLAEWNLNALSTVLSFHDTELSADVPNPVRG